MKYLAFIFLLSAMNVSYAEDRKVLYDNHGIAVIESIVEEKISYVKAEGSKSAYCEGIGSDFVKYGGGGLSLGGSDKSAKGSVGVGDQHGIEDLGGRSAEVLITRELMYRACELSVNTNSDHDQSLAIYQMFLTSIEAIFQSSPSEGDAAQSSSLAGSEPTAPES